jgi:hypothetical protein
MRTFRPGEDLSHRPTYTPAGFIWPSAMALPASCPGMARIQGGYPVDELETYAERNARLTEEAEKSRASPGKPKPANKPLL